MSRDYIFSKGYFGEKCVKLLDSRFFLNFLVWEIVNSCTLDEMPLALKKISEVRFFTRNYFLGKCYPQIANETKFLRERIANTHRPEAHSDATQCRLTKRFPIRRCHIQRTTRYRHVLLQAWGTHSYSLYAASFLQTIARILRNDVVPVDSLTSDCTLHWHGMSSYKSSFTERERERGTLRSFVRAKSANCNTEIDTQIESAAGICDFIAEKYCPICSYGDNIFEKYNPEWAKCFVHTFFTAMTFYR